MHSDDFARFMLSLAEAKIITMEQALGASKHYSILRGQDEREAAERAAKIGVEKPFERLVMASDPLLGMPLMFWALLIWLVISWIV